MYTVFGKEGNEMKVNMELDLYELKILRKALSDLSYAIYCGKASRKWNYPEKMKDADALYERVCDTQKHLEELEGGNYLKQN